uniref:Centrosome-associated FAM110 C-terminal domain-containing protein n=1 Tax=Strongyloides stercoralis TaxID=6248 RepID=A0A0K0ESH9_STRER
MTDIPYSRPSFIFNNHRTYYIPNYSYNSFGNSSNFTSNEYLNYTKSSNIKKDDLRNSKYSLENKKNYSTYNNDINGFKNYYEKSYDKAIENDSKKNTLIEDTLNYQKNITKPLLYNSSVSKNYLPINYRKSIFPSENLSIKKSDCIRKPAVPPRPSLYERNNCEKFSFVPELKESVKKQYINEEKKDNNDNISNDIINSKECNYQKNESVCTLKHSNDYSDNNTSQKNTKSTNTHTSYVKNEEFNGIIEHLSDLNFTSISCQEDNDTNTNDESNIILSFELANLKPVSTIERHARIIQWIHASSDYSHFPPTDDLLTDFNDEINNELAKQPLCV